MISQVEKLEPLLSVRYHCRLLLKRHLVALCCKPTPCSPVDDDETQTHHHERYAQCSETSGLEKQCRKHKTVVIKCAEQKHSRAVRFTHDCHLEKHSSRSHQYLGDRGHWLFVFGNNADVEDSRKDENEAWS